MPHHLAPTICPSCGHPLPEGLDKRSRVIEMIRTHPDLAYRRIAWICDVTRETVSHYARLAGLQRRTGGGTKRGKPVQLSTAICPHCRVPIPEKKMGMSGAVVRMVQSRLDLRLKDIAAIFHLDVRTVSRYARRAKVKRVMGGNKRKKHEIEGHITTKEAARMLRLTCQTVHTRRRAGLLSAVRMPDRTYQYERASVEALMSERDQ